MEIYIDTDNLADAIESQIRDIVRDEVESGANFDDSLNDLNDRIERLEAALTDVADAFRRL